MSTILIVDDDAMTLRMLEYTLGGGGHEVVVTADPEAAAGLAASHEVDAVILDILMPGRSGFEVLAELQDNPLTERVPVLMLSSLSKSSDRVKGLREGAHEYISKPFDPEELLLRLNRLLTVAPTGTAAFQGRLSTVSFAEVTQSLLNGGKWGKLEVQSGGVRGSVRVVDGIPVGATFGRLEGVEAVLAMLGLDTGAFRFTEDANAGVPSPDDVALPLQQVIFSAAWIEDEMQRWPVVEDDVVLWPLKDDQTPPPLPDELDVVLLAELLDEVARLPGVTVRDLITREVTAPRRTELGARILVHIGAVRVVPAADPRDGKKSPRRGNLPQAAEAVLEAAAERGFTADLAYVLLLVEPKVYGRILKIRQEIPADVLAGKGASITGAWRAGRAANLPLRAVSGQLVIHLAPLEPGPVLDQVRRRVADYACVIAWIADAEAIDLFSPFVELIEQGRTGQWGLVIATRPEVVERTDPILEGCFRWRVYERDPDDLEDVLDLAASSAP